MTTYLLRRTAASLVLLWLVVSLTFLFLHLAPGGVSGGWVGLSGGQTAEQRQRLERVYGLDRPLAEQYLTWLGRYVRGDLGTSWKHGRPVTRVIAEALPATLLLAVAAVGVELGLAVPLGIWAARRRGSPTDHALRGTGLFFFSLPGFWFGLMAILVFAYLWPVLPPSHMRSVDAHTLGPLGRALDVARHLVLPAAVLGITSAGGTLRFVRNSLLEVLEQDYIRTARAKGLSESRVVGVHALRNAVSPLIQLLGVNLPSLLNGALIVEVVFSWPGLGQVTYQSILTRDLPMILGTTTLAASLVILGNLAADLAQAATDPRVRHG